MQVQDFIPFQKIHEYFESLKPGKTVPIALEDAWKKKAEFLDEVSMQNNVVIFLWNTYSDHFLYMSDKLKVLSGLEPSVYIAKNGIEFSLSRLHPDQLEAAIAIHTKGINFFMENNNIGDRKNVLVFLNYLYKNANDEYVQVLQQTAVLDTDENNNPSLCISLIHNVGHIKKRDSVSCCTSIPGKINIFDYDFDKKCVDAPKIFSNQEKKIISLLALGDDTKSISQKLFISLHTVDTHRRNLIKKTSCIDATGVVAFARLINLI